MNIIFWLVVCFCLCFMLLGLLLILSSDNKPSKDLSKEDMIKSMGEEKYNKFFDENGKLRESPNYKPNRWDDIDWYGGN